MGGRILLPGWNREAAQVMTYQRIPALRTVVEFRQLLASLGLELPVDDRPLSAAEGSPLAAPLSVSGMTIGNRWCIHPMEGWDGTMDGRPSEHTLRRWSHFGESGAKLLWGGEAFAVRPDGRANPRQLCYRPENENSLRELLHAATQSHAMTFGMGADDDLLVGLQLTHSGRFCKPNRVDRFEPRIAYHHPVLDRRVGVSHIEGNSLWSDAEIRELIADYVKSAQAAQQAGFRFVDVKCCHGYLGHEFLSAYDRPGNYGGDFEGRTRFVREIVAAIRSECPGLEIGVRLSLWDTLAYSPDPAQTLPGQLGVGIPDSYDMFSRYPIFGADRDDPLHIDLREPLALIERLWRDSGVVLWNLTAGSPYYNPHIQRPAIYPPSDGYSPPEDPLIGCVRQIQAVRQVKDHFDSLTPLHPIGQRPLFVGSAYTYLQEYLPHVAQAVVRAGWVDSVGLGRLVLSDWQLPMKVLAGRNYMVDKKLCRTFSDCTTAPRHGMISGCYPLDSYYKAAEEAKHLKRIKDRSKTTS